MISIRVGLYAILGKCLRAYHRETDLEKNNDISYQQTVE